MRDNPKLALFVLWILLVATAFSFMARGIVELYHEITDGCAHFIAHQQREAEPR